MKDLSIIIPNYNSSKTIIETLDSIMSQELNDIEIIVVDDASTDNSLDLIKRAFPDVTIYENDKNHGASFTRNRGIQYAKSDRLLFIDSDVCIEKGLITRLLSASYKSDIVFPKIIYKNGLTMYPNSKRDEKYLLISPIFLITKKGLKKLNGSYFDINYTGYCEDTDFFLKCKLMKLTCKYIGNTLAVHMANKAKNREDRYYSEVVSTIYGFIKYFGYKDIYKLDHAFKPSNILKLYLLGFFNLKLFDAQLNDFEKSGSLFYKTKYLLTKHDPITNRGRLFLWLLTLKGLGYSLINLNNSLRARTELQILLKKNYAINN